MENKIKNELDILIDVSEPEIVVQVQDYKKDIKNLFLLTILYILRGVSTKFF